MKQSLINVSYSLFLCKVTKCHKNGTLLICITKEEETQIFRFDLYLPPLLKCNYTKI